MSTATMFSVTGDLQRS